MREREERPIKTPTTYPTIVKHSSRIAWGIDYFDTEEDAKVAGDIVTARGDTANGGWFDGLPLGRDTSFDYFDEKLGRKLYAVTRR